MTLAVAVPLTPGWDRAGRDVLAEPGGYPAQDATADLAGIRRGQHDGELLPNLPLLVYSTTCRGSV